MAHAARTIAATVGVAWHVGAVTVLIVAAFGVEPSLGPNGAAVSTPLFIALSVVVTALTTTLGHAALRVLERLIPSQAGNLFWTLVIGVTALYTLGTTLGGVPGAESAGARIMVGLMHFTVTGVPAFMRTRSTRSTVLDLQNGPEPHVA